MRTRIMGQKTSKNDTSGLYPGCECWSNTICGAEPVQMGEVWVSRCNEGHGDHLFLR